MKSDINILGILTKYDEDILNEINENSTYEVETYGEDEFLKLAFGLALNGRPLEDYNIYIIINSYDEENGRYNIFAGGLKVLSKKEYNDILFKRTFIKFLKGMKRNMDLTIYKLPVRLDDKNPNLREGDFDEIKNINVDLENFQSQGIFTAATTFKIKA